MSQLSEEKETFIRGLADEDGCIEPADMVQAARDPTCPIHGDFIWDNDQAAEAYRIDQARRLIRLVRVEITEHHRTISAVAYVADPDRPARSRRYVDIMQVRTDAEKAQAVLEEEMRRVLHALRRAQRIAEILNLSGEFDRLLQNAQDIMDAASRAAAAAAATTRRGRGRPPGRRGGVQPAQAV